MRAIDIVRHISSVLPKYADDFTDQIAIDSLSRSGTTVTATTALGHGLAIGRQVNISGAKTPIQISSLTRSGIVGMMVTSSDHDITNGSVEGVEISGANESNFNGTFTGVNVDNRRNIRFVMADSGAVAATGAPLLLNGSSPYQSYNGLKQVTAVPSATAFQYEVADATIYSPAEGVIVAKTNPRVAAALDFETLERAYTTQSANDAWLFVLLGNAIANKSRRINADSVDNIQAGNYFNQKLIQVVQLYVFLPTSDQVAGVGAMDRCQELLSPICRSIVGVKFPSLVENTNNPLMLVGHGVRAYTHAYYVHEYDFEATLQLGPSDIYDPGDDVAFRDINFDIGTSIGTENITAFLDLDDSPI